MVNAKVVNAHMACSNRADFWDFCSIQADLCSPKTPLNTIKYWKLTKGELAERAGFGWSRENSPQYQRVSA